MDDVDVNKFTSVGQIWSRQMNRVPARNLLIVAIAFLSASSSFLAAQQDSQGDDPTVSDIGKFAEVAPPPVTRIVMFSSGLSQLVHEGTVTGNQSVSMRFSEHDVDDVLKSLVFEDQGGGSIRSVQYNPAPDAQDVAATNLGPALTLAQTLQKYRGEKVEVQTADKTITGSILSVENRQTDEAFIETLTLVNEDGFISIPVNDFRAINFVDEKLRKEFGLAMSGLKKSRLANSKEIVLLFEGEGERKVRFSYNVDSPIWRMTYRLDLGTTLQRSKVGLTSTM